MSFERRSRSEPGEDKGESPMKPEWPGKRCGGRGELEIFEALQGAQLSFPSGSVGKNLPASAGDVGSLVREDPLEM